MASSPSNASGVAKQHQWDPEQMLRLYLHDYMVKRGMHEAAEIFKNEVQLVLDPDNKVAVDIPEGFLHEWWTIFYDQYVSSTRPGPEPSSKVPKMTDDNARNSYTPPPLTSRVSIGEQRPQRIQHSPRYYNPQVPSTLYSSYLQHLGYRVEDDVEPSLRDLSIANNMKFLELPGSNSNHSPQDVGRLAQKQVLKDSGIGTRGGNYAPSPKYLLDLVHRTMQPLDGPHETKTTEALNIGPLNRWAANNPVLASLLQEPSYRQQCQVLKTQIREAVPAQVLACTPKTLSQHLTSPKTGLSNKDGQMDLMIRTAEHQNQQDHQQLQMQSQNVEIRRKRMKTVSLRPGPGESSLDCMSATDGKPVDENVESFLSFENEHADHEIVPFSNLKRVSTTYSRNENKGFSFKEIGCLHSSKSKVLSTHFSSDGNILAGAGHEKKVFIWDLETLDCVTTAEAHSLLITDVRFRPGSTIFATSSFDRSVRLWDAAKPTRSLFKFHGHAEQVMSLDFHPRKVDLLCSCDSNVIQLWNVNQGSCKQITKGGSKQVRFQPRGGKFLATATGNNINIIDVETDSLMCRLKGHVKDVLSICWDRNGDYIASVSEDSARVWSAVSDGECINELHSNGNTFQSCIFHPAYFNLLVIGGYQSLELWSPTEGNRTWAIPAHNGLIAGLADSPENELIASASHDHCVKLWN